MNDEKLSSIVNQVYKLQEEMNLLPEIEAPTPPPLPPNANFSPKSWQSPEKNQTELEMLYEEKTKMILQQRNKLLEEIRKLNKEEAENEEVKRYIQNSLQKARDIEQERKNRFPKEEAEIMEAEQKWKDERISKRNTHALNLIKVHVSFATSFDNNNDNNDEEEDDHENIGCVICGKSENVIYCGGVCGRSIHLTCASPEELVDSNVWYCIECKDVENSCIICGKTTPTDLMHCNGVNCKRCIHKSCLTEPIVNNGDMWFCLDCLEIN